jgi:DNA-binding NarL/FixJ family response regulator
VNHVRVLTVDDQAVFREAVRELLVDTPGFEHVGEASSGPDAIAAVTRTETDLVLLDVHMPEMDGIETARRIAAQAPDVVVVLVSADDPDDLPVGATSCGAAAFVPKRDLAPRRLTRLWASLRG